MIRFYLVCLPYWIFVDYIFVRLNLTYLPANNLRRISTMYVRGYLQGSENGRVVTINNAPLTTTLFFFYWKANKDVMIRQEYIILLLHCINFKEKINWPWKMQRINNLVLYIYIQITDQCGPYFRNSTDCFI